MAKIKLVKLEVDGNLLAIAAALRHQKYSDDRGWGFNFLERTSQTISAYYIEKFVSKETIKDPFGDTSEIETIRYTNILFQLSHAISAPSEMVLEVASPPRSIRTLIQALSYCSDRIFASDVNIPLLSVYKELSKQSREARIVRIRATKVPISINSIAKVEISSSNDAYVDYLNAFEDTEKFIDKIEIDKPYGPSSGTLELSRSGLICCDEDSISRTRDLILSKYLY